MPPRKAAGAGASPAQRGGSRLAAPPAASPARSTRNTRSHRDDEWDNESMHSSFKVPAPRTARTLNLGMHDTSVNVAAAFHAAQTGHLPTPTTSSYRKSAPRSDAGRRALSPAEQLADSARALSPVRYFLHPGDSNNDSGEYPSFASLGQQSSTNTSYDYQKEEEYVRSRMRNESVGGHSRKTSMSESRRRKKAEDGDMPYRPAEDDYAAESGGSEDDEGEGGIVNGGALEGRASTRGKTKEKGEGYLGMGLGIQPKKRSSRKSGDMLESDDEGDQRGSPAPSYGGGRNGYSRSPTPAQLLRAITPRLSPGPRPLTPRRRQPSSLRTIITNILHGLVLALRFVTVTMISLIDSAIIKPLKSITGSGKLAMRRLKRDWWKVLGGLVALSLLLRLLGRPWSAQTGSVSHGAIGFETADELASRLSSLEHAIASLSHPTERQPIQGNVGISDDAQLEDRLTRLEASLADERQRLDELRSKSASVGQLRQDLDKVVFRVDSHDSDIASASSTHQSVDRIEQELRGLRTRVDGVEKEVRNALDDGRLNKAIERILPDWMPVKRTGHRIDIEPVFWNELKRVLVGKSDMDKAVQDALAGTTSGGVSKEDLERFGDKLFEQKSAQGLIVSKEQFLMAMNNELEDLKSRLDRAEFAPPKASTITIKGAKGDDIVPLLSSLIDTAILKYSKDTLATPDYALYTAGARVVPSITSDTLVMKSANRLGKWLAGSRDIEGRAPATALHPDNSVGSCWPFNGSQGQLGVLLSRRVVVTDITIEHAAKELSPDVKTAPKAIEVWGLVEGQANKDKVASYLATEQALKSYVHTLAGANVRSSIPPSPDHLLLASVQYDPSAENPTQTFPVLPAIIELGIDVGIVIFKIESNWGGDLTCLYRVRVHGEKVEDAEL